MFVPSLRTGLALAALGGLAAAAHAQLPPGVPAAPAPPAPRVVKWPGGYMVTDGREVIVRSTTPGGGSTNIVRGSGNGVGNRIVVDGGPGGVTIVENARNGVGNRLVINPDDLLLDLDALLGDLKVCPKPVVVPPKPAEPVIPPAVDPAPAAVPPAPADPNAVPAPLPPADPNAAPAVPAAPPSYKGKDSPFWTKKAFSDAHDCNLYWDPTNKLWFRYHADDDTYRPVATQPAPPVEEK